MRVFRNRAFAGAFLCFRKVRPMKSHSLCPIHGFTTDRRDRRSVSLVQEVLSRHEGAADVRPYRPRRRPSRAATRQALERAANEALRGDHGLLDEIEDRHPEAEVTMRRFHRRPSTAAFQQSEEREAAAGQDIVDQIDDRHPCPEVRRVNRPRRRSPEQKAYAAELLERADAACDMFDALDRGND
jgi:hypothetical protein